MDLQKLPDLALRKVLSFTSHEEKLRTLMLVSKRFYALLQEEAEEMCIYDRRTPYKPSWGFFSQDEIRNQFIVRAKDLAEPVALRFPNLRKLFLYKVKNLTHFLNATNESSLSQLVELKIHHLYSHPNGKIHLPGLKRLWMKWFYGDLILNTPNLESLDLLDDHSEKCFQLCDAGKLKFLKCRQFAANKSSGFFVNLEHLICCSVDSLLSLEKLPKLRRIELLPEYESRFNRIPQSELIEDLQKQKKKFNRSDLEIWHCGFKENYHKLNPDLFTDFFRAFLSFGNQELMSRNNRALEVFDYFDYEDPVSVFPGRMNFCSVSEFMRKFPNFERIPNNFFKVFINIKAVLVDCEVDGPNLIRFLKNAKRVHYFEVNPSSSSVHIRFDLKFFEELCQIQSFHYLYLKNAFPLDIHPVDVSFFLNFTNLKHVKVSDYDHEQRCRLLKISLKKFKQFLRTVRSTLFLFELASGSNLLYFSAYGPEEGKICHNIFANPDEYLLGSQDDLGDVFFSDVEETASYLEKMEPK